jgi:hypothetical protein
MLGPSFSKRNSLGPECFIQHSKTILLPFCKIHYYIWQLLGVFRIIWLITCGGGSPHALRLWISLLYAPLILQISRNALSQHWYQLTPSTREQWYLYEPHLSEAVVHSRPIYWEELEATAGTGNGWLILLRGPHGAWGFLMCSKSTTRVTLLKVPPGGLVPRIFLSLKIRRPPPGLNPWHSSHEVGTEPLDYRGRCSESYWMPIKRAQSISIKLENHWVNSHDISQWGALLKFVSMFQIQKKLDNRIIRHKNLHVFLHISQAYLTYYILWHADLLLGNNCERGNDTTAVIK